MGKGVTNVPYSRLPAPGCRYNSDPLTSKRGAVDIGAPTALTGKEAKVSAFCGRSAAFSFSRASNRAEFCSSIVAARPARETAEVANGRHKSNAILVNPFIVRSPQERPARGPHALPPMGRRRGGLDYFVGLQRIQNGIRQLQPFRRHLALDGMSTGMPCSSH